MKRFFLFLVLCLSLLTAFNSLPLAHSPKDSSQKINLTAVINLLLGSSNSEAISAIAGASPTNGTAPLSVDFTTDSTGPVETWRWDFDGDGNWEQTDTTAKNYTYTYTTAGSYSAILQVEDSQGNTENDQLLITVAAPRPLISFNASAEQLFTGNSSDLSWSVSWADSVSIDQGIGEVNSSGSQTVTPTTSTLYTLTAVGPGGSSTASIDLHVLTPAAEELVAYINVPFEGQQFSTPTVTVSGIINQPSALVWVNGVTATVAGDTFSADIPLVAGLNSIDITASYNGILVTDSTWVVREYNYSPQSEGSFGAQYEELVPSDALTPAYDESRFAVITGMVENEQSAALANVAVTIKNHPEYGTAYTDSLGRFSLPVEGGTLHTVVYEHEQYLTAHRKIEVKANDLGIIDLVRLVTQDSAVSNLTFDGNSATILTHESSLVSDSFGNRSMTMVFQGDNHAYEVDEQGQRIRELPTINTRATEFTTPEAMPAVLPPNSAYTYCAELSVDGFARIEFAKPVVTWLDNFLGFDVGEVVPMGYYNRDTGAWVPSDNGVVIRLLDHDGNGSVDSLDATGDGVRDDLNSSGSFDDEVAGLDDLARYPINATFWRVEVSHFTPWDENWASVVPADAVPPNPDGTPVADQPENDPKKDPCTDDIASSVEPRSRIFHEDIAIPGTDFSLHYSSDRVPGYHTVIDVPASGATVPASLIRIEVILQIAGREMKQTLAALPNQKATFSWDGLDYLGQRVTQPTTAHISLGFVYRPLIQSANPDFSIAFAQPGLTPTAILARTPQTITTDWDLTILPPGISTGNNWNLAEGWTLSSHHVVLPMDTTTMHKGDGTTVQNKVAIIETFAGSDEYHCHDGLNNNVPATEAGFDGLGPDGMVMDSKGNMYISVWGCDSVYKVNTDGIINHYAGIEESRGYSGDGGPATSAMLSYPYGLAVDAEDNLYIADKSNSRVRKVDTNGIITTVVGNGQVGTLCNNNCDATTYTISHVNNDVEVDSDGNIYVADAGLGGISKTDPNGIFTTIAGRCWDSVIACTDGPDADGLPANEVDFYPMALALAPDGSIYFTSEDEHYVGKIDVNGIFHILAGGDTAGFSGDGGPATAALLDHPHGITLDPEGNVYFYDNGNHRIRKIDTLGKITTVAGSGTGGLSGDGGPATHANMGDDYIYSTDSTNFCDIAYHDNKLYVGDMDNGRLRVITLPDPAFETATDPGDITFAEESGQGHIFSAAGRHKKSIDLQTGTILRTFSYDANGNLTTITNIYGLQTTIQYSEDGLPISITSPDGLVTGLSVTPDNNLTHISYPDAAHYNFSYGTGGLLTTKTEPNGNLFGHNFNSEGRISNVTDENGGDWSYTRTVAINGGSTVQVTTGENNVTSYTERTASNGVHESDITYPSGNLATIYLPVDGLYKTTDLSCGLEQTTLYNTDSQYQTLYPQQVQTVTPAGLKKTVSTARTYLDTNVDRQPDQITQTVTLNGKTSSLAQNTLTAQQISTTPTGRTTTLTYNPSTLLPSRHQISGIHDTLFGHDSQGRLTSLSQDNRNMLTGYSSSGFLNSLTIPEGQTTTYSHDAVGRVTSKHHPDGNQTGMAYDSKGNRTTIITPGGNSHEFTFNKVNKVSSYSLPGSGGSYSFAYDKDRRLTGITFPSGGVLTNGYSNDRLISSQITGDTINISYLAGDRINSVSRGTESISNTFDGKLLLSTTSSGSLSQAITLGYNDDFLLTSMGYAGTSESFSYDNDGLLITAGTTTTISRNAGNGLPEQVSDGTLTQVRSFNGFGELSGESSTVNSAAVASWTATRDRNGLITQKVEIVNSVSHTINYVYDVLGRLITVERDGLPVETYLYDANGNRTSNHSGASYSYDSQDRLTSDGTTTYSYTADGFLQSKVDGGNVTTYNYSIRGELLGVTLPDTTQIEYTYDPFGRRIAKSVNSTVVEKYLWSGKTTLLAVYDGSDSLLMRFEYADTRMPIAMDKGGTRYYLIFDYNGSPRLVTDTAGTVIKQLEYDSFGNVMSDSNPSFTLAIGFGCGLADQNTGLILFGARDYDPTIGRWTAKDPIFFGGGDTNLYAYVSNDPINLIDMGGLKWEFGYNFMKKINSFVGDVIDESKQYYYDTADILADVNRNLRKALDPLQGKREKEKYDLDHENALKRNDELRDMGDKYSEQFTTGWELINDFAGSSLNTMDELRETAWQTGAKWYQWAGDQFSD